MPYYWWRGINLEGVDVKGSSFARSVGDLDLQLLRQDIGLIKARQNNLYLFFNPILSNHKNDALNYLSILLNSHIRLNIALELVSNTIKHPYLKAVYIDLTQAVQEGQTLNLAVSNYKDIFDELTCAVISSSESAGDISRGLRLLVEHNKVINDFNKKIKSAMLMPIISFVGFLFLLLAIFIFVIPRFEMFFATFNKPLPKATQLLINISHFITSLSMIFIMPAVCLIAIITKFLLDTESGKYYKDQFIFFIPGLRNFNKLIIQVKFLRIMTILLSGKVHLLDALFVTRNGISNVVVQKSISRLILSIEAGNTLSSAIAQDKILNSTEVDALIKIGESSSQLTLMFNQAADIYQKKLYLSLEKMSTLVQPVILILLGLLVAAVVCAVYLPIFTLSSLIV